MDNSIIHEINKCYKEFSASERVLADFFLQNREIIDFSSSHIAKLNFVSEATVSRFSQRLGYQGYREFIFVYERYISKKSMGFDELTENVLYTYRDLLSETHAFVNETQSRRIVDILSESNYVYVYGTGNSALCAHEFKMRFMRLGLRVESTSDSHIMKMNSVLMDDKSTLIVISMSGKNLLPYLKTARKNGAKTILITADKDSKYKNLSDETLICASIKDLDVGNVISPQFPVLLLLDIIYAHYLNLGFTEKQKLLEDTLTYVNKE